MKYFKPELFVAFNSEDVQMANEAARAWEQAVTAYDKHLKTIRRRLPPKVRELSKLHLHDAEFVALGKDVTVPDARSATLVVKQGRPLTVLVYFLLEEPRVTAPINDKVFSSQGVHWLYDELDLLGPTDIIHEILFSDGSVYRFRFRHLAILTIREHAAAFAPQHEQTRQPVKGRPVRSLPPRRKAATA